MVFVTSTVGEIRKLVDGQAAPFLLPELAGGPQASQEQSSQHALGRLVATHSARAHLHPANGLFGAVIRPGHIRLPVEIQAVLKFLPVFEQPDFSPGEWITQEGHLPYFSYTPAVLDFIRALSGNGFIQPFDWMNWREGEQLVDHPVLLGRANLQTLLKLLTANVRADRFTEGHLAGTFESGHMIMILKRMAEIHSSRASERESTSRNSPLMTKPGSSPTPIASTRTSAAIASDRMAARRRSSKTGTALFNQKRLFSMLETWRWARGKRSKT
jgi:hypothetical protein